MTLISIVCGLAIVLTATTVMADSYPPSPSCSKPYKPYKFNSNAEIQNYTNDLEQYKRCIKNFVDEQQQAIEVHKNAATQAIDEWNRFIRLEMN